MSWFAITIFGAICLVAYLETYGHRVILKEPTSGKFKIGARIDVTFIGHVTGYFLLCFIHPWLAITAGIMQEIVDGFTSPQGMDFMDIFADGWGIVLWYHSDLVSLVQLVRG